MAGQSTHIGRKGVGCKRRRRSGLAPAPIVRKPVVSVGRYADRFFDPVTGRRLSAPLQEERLMAVDVIGAA